MAHLAAAAFGVAIALVVPCASRLAADSTIASATSWTVYHGDLPGSGVAASVTSVDTGSPAWTSPVLDGQLYGEPLVAAGSVFVATENDTVYALSSATGAVSWSTHVGNPVPSSALPCGNVSPDVGITGTPVIDTSKNEIFVVADELVDGNPEHVLVGLSTSSGAVDVHQDVDPPGADPAALLQRTGLTLDAGQVVFGMGGNYGDCSAYRGRVVSVSESGGTPTFFTVDAASGQSEGAVWMGGAAPAVDGSGNIWVSAGNGSVHSSSLPYDDSDSALELSSSLHLLQYFAPTTWAQDNASDRDMSMAPVLLGDGQALLAGKSRIAYLLSQSKLGGIGGQESSVATSCGDDIDGGAAVFETTVYLPCLTGPVAVRVTSSPPGIRMLWRADAGGGPPIVAAGEVWSIGQDGTLYGLDPATGAVRQQATVGPQANHFPTPSVGDGLLVAPAANRVVAFTAAGSSTATTEPVTTTAPASSTTTAPSETTTSVHVGFTTPGSASSSGGGLSTATLAGIAGGGLIALASSAMLLRRARRRRPLS